MNKTVLIVLAVIIVMGAGYYFMKGSYAPGTGQAPANQTGTQTDTQAATSPDTINISGFAFSPGTLTVKAGSTVTWVNQDSVVHSIKSATFSSKDLQKGDTYRFTFDTKGTYSYSCGIHPSMTGSIVVE